MSRYASVCSRPVPAMPYFRYIFVKGERMRNLITAAIIVVFCGAAVRAFDFHVGMYGAFNIPLGEFAASDSFNGEGFARPGFGGGVLASIPILPRLAWSSDISVLAVAFDDEEYIEETFGSGPDIDSDGGGYLLIPILTGVRASIARFGPVELYGAGRTGIAVCRQSELEGSVYNLYLGSFEGSIEFETALTFAVSGELGVIIGPGITIGSRFAYLGKPEIDYSANIASVPGEDEREFHLLMVQLVAGYEF